MVDRHLGLPPAAEHETADGETEPERPDGEGADREAFAPHGKALPARQRLRFLDRQLLAAALLAKSAACLETEVEVVEDLRCLLGHPQRVYSLGRPWRRARFMSPTCTPGVARRRGSRTRWPLWWRKWTPSSSSRREISRIAAGRLSSHRHRRCSPGWAAPCSPCRATTTSPTRSPHASRRRGGRSKPPSARLTRYTGRTVSSSAGSTPCGPGGIRAEASPPRGWPARPRSFGGPLGRGSGRDGLRVGRGDADRPDVRPGRRPLCAGRPPRVPAAQAG